MTSTVDVTFPADNVKVSKATMRAQLLIIRDEISALQARTSVPGIKAFYDFVEMTELEATVQRVHDRNVAGNLPKDIAFGRVSLT